jgi:biopolymer transport protein ExbB/TolQ
MILFSHNIILNSYITLPITIPILLFYTLLIYQSAKIFKSLEVEFVLLDELKKHDDFANEFFRLFEKGGFRSSYSDIRSYVVHAVEPEDVDSIIGENSLTILRFQDMAKVGRSNTNWEHGTISASMEKVLIQNIRYHKLFFEVAITLGIFGEFYGLTQSVLGFHSKGEVLKNLIDALVFAFGSTLVALIVSIPTKIIEVSIEKKQDELLSSLDDYCRNSGLLAKLQYKQTFNISISDEAINKMGITLADKVVSGLTSESQKLTLAVDTFNNQLNLLKEGNEKVYKELIEKYQNLNAVTENVKKFTEGFLNIANSFKTTNDWGVGVDSVADSCKKFSDISNAMHDVIKSIDDKLLTVNSKTIYLESSVHVELDNFNSAITNASNAMNNAAKELKSTVNEMNKVNDAITHNLEVAAEMRDQLRDAMQKESLWSKFISFFNKG